MNSVRGRAAAEFWNTILFNMLLVAFMNTAEGLLKLKSCMALATGTTTMGAAPAGMGGALAATVGARITGAPAYQRRKRVSCEDIAQFMWQSMIEAHCCRCFLVKSTNRR